MVGEGNVETVDTAGNIEEAESKRRNTQMIHSTIENTHTRLDVPMPSNMSYRLHDRDEMSKVRSYRA